MYICAVGNNKPHCFNPSRFVRVADSRKSGGMFRPSVEKREGILTR